MKLEDGVMSSEMSGYIYAHPVWLSISRYFKYTQTQRKIWGIFGSFVFFSTLTKMKALSETKGLVISQLILGGGTWTDSLFSSVQTYLPHPIPQLWFRRQAALAPSQFWIRLPCHYLVVAPTRVLYVRLSGALLPAFQALQTGATHHRRPWSVDLLQLWQLCARMGLARNVHFLLMFSNTECSKWTSPCK